MNYFNAYTRVNLNGRILQTPDLSIEFDYDFGSTKKANVMTLKIYNVSQQTIAAAEQRGGNFAPVVVESGYISDYGAVLIGEIYESEIKEAGNDIVLEMKCRDRSARFDRAIINRSWAGSVPALTVLQELFSAVGITSANINPGEIITYENGFFADGKIKDILNEIAKDTKSEYHLRNSEVYFQPLNFRGKIQTVRLSYDTGLLELKKKGKNYIGRSLLNYRYRPGFLIQVESKEYTGNLKIINGAHKVTDTLHESSFEAVVA